MVIIVCENNDNIIMRSIWRDVDLHEVNIFCKNKHISVSTRVYLSSSSIEEFTSQLIMFLQRKKTSLFWKSGEFGNDFTPSNRLSAQKLEPTGHVQLEDFLELDYAGYLGTHNCCFYNNTEYGLLYAFAEKLYQIKGIKTGTEIALIPKKETDYL